MTLDESIKRYTDNAEYERTHGSLQGCLEFRQLAEWLSELKQLRERTKWMCFDGMTNGEVIKTLFPSCKTRRENTSMDNFMEFTLDGLVGYAIEKSWWNAPYKAESEDTE